MRKRIRNSLKIRLIPQRFAGHSLSSHWSSSKSLQSDSTSIGGWSSSSYSSRAQWDCTSMDSTSVSGWSSSGYGSKSSQWGSTSAIVHVTTLPEHTTTTGHHSSTTTESTASTIK